MAGQSQKFPKVAFGANLTKFEGERAPEKLKYFGQIFLKTAQNVIFILFFPKIGLRRRIFLTKYGPYSLKFLGNPALLLFVETQFTKTFRSLTCNKTCKREKVSRL